MNNTKYKTTWLVTWVEDGITYNETYDWRGMAEDLYLDRKDEFGNATLDELVPEGVVTQDMGPFPWETDEWNQIVSLDDLMDDACDWCGMPMPHNEAGHCCTSCFLEMEVKELVC